MLFMCKKPVMAILLLLLLCCAELKPNLKRLPLRIHFETSDEQLDRQEVP